MKSNGQATIEFLVSLY